MFVFHFREKTMQFKASLYSVALFSLLASYLISCAITPPEEEINSTPISSQTSQSTILPKLTGYQFPSSIDPQQQYLFYLHGKIIEDQGIPAISPEFGEYQYSTILKEFSQHGFVVVSEIRAKHTDAMAYARKIVDQVTNLINAGVPPMNITVVGASKGAWIAIHVSHLLTNEEVNFVILAICNPGALEVFRQNQIALKGNVLSIYDAVDEYAGSCQELFSYSEGKGISTYDEIVLDIGTGHGILYQPLDEWVLPTVAWAKGDR
jgi:hypothetical protein